MTNGQAVERQGSSPQAFRSRSIKFTPERLQQIENLVERGKSRQEIADILGVTVGSLQVTCSKMGISLRRPKIINGVYLFKKPTSLHENANGTQQTDDQNGRLPAQPKEEQPERNSQSQPAEIPIIALPQQGWTTTPEACSATFAIRFHYRGIERTHELPLTTHTIGLLALEATLREMSIGELIAEIIRATVDKNLFPRVLDNIVPGVAGEVCADQRVVP
jgi:hypothetical protein